MTEDDAFRSVQTLLRTFDLDPITRPDPEQAIRRGRRHRRVRAVDKGLALASVAVVVVGGAALAMGPLRSAVDPSPTVGVTTSPSPTPAPSTSTTKSQLVDVANGSTVDAGKSGAALRLTSAGMCTEPAAGLPKTQANDIPTACYDPRSSNFDLAASGWVGGNAGWGTHSLYYGLTTTAASAVTVTDSEGHTYLGTLARIPGANWYAFYVVMPFAPFTIDAQHPTPPPSGTVLVTDAQGKQLGDSKSPPPRLVVSPSTVPCSAVALNPPPGESGAATAEKAISQFLTTGSSLEGLPTSGWTSVDGRTYRSGSSSVELTRLANGGFVVTGASSC